jgi:hypothetical protein
MEEANRDEIIEEVRAIRDELASRHGYDIRALYEQAKWQESESRQLKVRLEPKRIAMGPEKPA